jgi:chloramphenicol 3-O phosphotransferase
MGQGHDQPGRVLFLNGGSSAGKTTLGRTLQSGLPDPWLLLGIDQLMWALPPEMVNDPDGISVHEGVITRGDRFMAIYDGFQLAVAALVRGGVNVILDDVMLDGATDQARWDVALQGLAVCWIGVRCAPGIAAEREAGRGTRLPGIARHQAEWVHQGVRYDVEVDTGVMDRRETSGVIVEYLTRRWSIPVSSSFDRPLTLPRTSAWMPEGAIRPAPWER